MTDYRIIWAIEIETDNPTAAADEAREIQRDGIASSFIVIDRENQNSWMVDLDDGTCEAASNNT